MNGLASGAPDANRLALALLLALGLHAALLLGLPAEGWSLRYPQPLRFEVALLPRIDLPPPLDPPIPPAPEPAESASPPGPAVTGALPEPAPSTTLPMAVTEPASVSPPAPVVTPPPAPLPPKPAIRTPPAPPPTPPKPVVRTPPTPSKPVVRAAPPSAKSPPVAKKTPAPRPVSKPVAPSPPAKPAAPPRTPGESIAKPAQIKPLPAPSSASVETRPPPLAKPATRPTEPSRRNSGTGSGKTGRLDSAALLGQIAGLDADAQRQTRGSAREQRVSLADTRSLAGFYAADWARKVSRVGELNFPDAARRLEPGSGPLLEVAIRADGSLREVRVLRSSGSAELDRAARRIVELAAPYPPFSPELRRQIDVLRIAAPWRFDPVGRVRVR